MSKFYKHQHLQELLSFRYAHGTLAPGYILNHLTKTTAILELHVHVL